MKEQRLNLSGTLCPLGMPRRNATYLFNGDWKPLYTVYENGEPDRPTEICTAIALMLGLPMRALSLKKGARPDWSFRASDVAYGATVKYRDGLNKIHRTFEIDKDYPLLVFNHSGKGEYNYSVVYFFEKLWSVLKAIPEQEVVEIEVWKAEIEASATQTATE